MWTGSDDRPQRGKTHRKLEESEEDSILSRESDKRRRQQQQHRRSPNLGLFTPTWFIFVSAICLC